MGIFDINGIALSNAFGSSGARLSEAFDINGQMVFPDASQITVMSFNVGCFYSEWHPAPASTGNVFYLRNKGIFEKYTTDFAGLTEWNNQIGTVAASVLMDEFFPAWYPNYTPYASQNAAITSAFSDSLDSTPTLIAYQTQGSETRYYQKSYFTICGKSVCCITTHLDLNDSVRTAQFAELMDAVEDEEYFIITGDFNFQIVSAGDSAYNKSVKVALDKGYNSAQNASNLLMTWYSGETVSGSAEVYALDNIITSPSIAIDNAIVDTTKLTDGLCAEYGIIIDHLPLIATLQIGGTS